MHHYCMICGVFVRPAAEGPGIVAPTDHLEWDQVVRAG